jgi:hypothetical protein
MPPTQPGIAVTMRGRDTGCRMPVIISRLRLGEQAEADFAALKGAGADQAAPIEPLLQYLLLSSVSKIRGVCP